MWSLARWVVGGAILVVAAGVMVWNFWPHYTDEESLRWAGFDDVSEVEVVDVEHQEWTYRLVELVMRGSEPDVVAALRASGFQGQLQDMPRRRPPIYTVLLGPLPEMDDLREGHDQIWQGDVPVDRSFVLGVDAAGRTVLVLTASAN